MVVVSLISSIFVNNAKLFSQGIVRIYPTFGSEEHLHILFSQILSILFKNVFLVCMKWYFMMDIS